MATAIIAMINSADCSTELCKKPRPWLLRLDRVIDLIITPGSMVKCRCGGSLLRSDGAKRNNASNILFFSLSYSGRATVDEGGPHSLLSYDVAYANRFQRRCCEDWRLALGSFWLRTALRKLPTGPRSATSVAFML